MKHPLYNLISLQKLKLPVGIYSACTANELVLEACMEEALKTNSILLIEATSNQVNQYGGYTGMKPQDFYQYVTTLANKVQLPMKQIILGGDHLGPLTWTHLNESEAMEEAKELIKQYVLAGFTKIHLDTSMRVKDDDTSSILSTHIIARRGAILAKVAEIAYQEYKSTHPDAYDLVYIVGSEVPIPGGATEKEDALQITTTTSLQETIDTFKEAFNQQGIKEAWDKVIGIVVQPGVEFGDAEVHEYNRQKAKELTNYMRQIPNLILEGHSTDYQTKYHLKEMVEDGVGILKVGPALTFALREGLFALANMEGELIEDTKQSHFIDVLEKTMLQNPNNWKKHYHGTENELKIKRKYSYSDRCRYYLPEKKVAESIQILLDNLSSIDIPLSLLSAYMPKQYTKVREKLLTLSPKDLVKDVVKECIREYLFASQQQKLS